MKEIKVRLTFLEGVLGTEPNNPDIHREFIASKAPDSSTVEEEIAAIGVEEYIEKSMTIFPKTADGIPFIWDYQIRGFFKEACGCLKKVAGTRSSKVTAYKKVVDGLVFVEPRKIHMDLHGMKLDNCQRPLRAQTAQGERISLANSEAAPEGTTIEFVVSCLRDDDIELVKEWLDYGKFKGMLQWRNSGKGRFSVEYLEQ